MSGMRTFKQHVFLQEGGRSRGEAMEHSIVTAVNGSEQEQKGIVLGSGQKVVDSLKLNGYGEVLGSAHIKVTGRWSKYWPDGKVPSSTKTPKTDIKIGKKKKISLKTGSAGQLMSGGKNEATATFFAAIEASGIEMTPIVQKIEDGIQNLSPASLADSNLRTAIKVGKDEAVVRANRLHKEIQVAMRKLFQSSTDFAYHFVYEAMTGQVKFGGNDGTCSHFLTCTFDGDNAHLIPVENRSYVTKMADRVKVIVRFKSDSQKIKKVKTGKYKYWSVVALVIDKLNEEIEQYANGTLITEGIASSILRKMKQFITKIWSAVKKWLAKSSANVMEFLGITPDISFSNNINFAA